MCNPLRYTFLVLLGVLMIPAEPATAAEFYYGLIFGSQSHPKQLRYTHTWATFVRAVGEGPDPNNYSIEMNTISWLPRTLDVHVWDLRPEPGINLDLYETLRTVYANNERVTVWGPFLISPEIYARAVQVAGVLHSGQAEYRAISGRDPLIADCIHAVATIDPIFGRNHYPLIRIGKPASRYIARQIRTRSPIDQTRYDNEWLIPRLNLDRYPIQVIPPRDVRRLPFAPDHRLG